MAYKITYKSSVARDLKCIAKADAKRILNKIESTLRVKPDAHPMLKGAFSGLRKLREGDYRVIFTIIQDDVLVLRIGNRKDVYK